MSRPRQKCQAIIKDACTKAGIDLELKSVTAAVFFGSDVANPDTYQKFWADMQMFTTTMTQPDPQLLHGPVHSPRRSRRRPTSGRAATSGAGATRSTTTPTRLQQVELDPAKRAALFIKLNDLVVEDKHVIPLFARPRPYGIVNKLKPALSAWDSATGAIGYWYRDAT